MESFSFSYEETLIAHLPENIQKAIEAALAAAKHAYAPYSGFKVGAAVLLENGSIQTGVNHENASYPAGICAERSLLSQINPTEKIQQIKAIVVTNIGNTLTDVTPLSPCGICRQTIVEQQLAQDAPIAVYMCSPSGRVVYVEDATSLLPFYFSNKNLQ